jgi:ATP-binding cassette, subfamily C, bacterial CydC
MISVRFETIMRERMGPKRGRGPLLRLLRLAKPLRGRLVVAMVTGALATGSAVALLAVAGWLLARASQHPDIVALGIAIVAVRALVIGRGVFRYAERLTSHDVAFRVLAVVRVGIWRRLEALSPAGLLAFRSGDLLARLVGDVDATQDLFVRGITPPAAAGLVGAGSVLACLLLFSPAGILLAVGLLAGGIVVPCAVVIAARTSARTMAPARARFSAELADLLTGAADLQVFGAADEALQRIQAANRELTGQGRRSAAASGLGTGLAALAVGLTVWAILLAGVWAVGSGALTRVPLAVVTLTALAAFEAVGPLPAAAMQLAQARTSAQRVASVVDAPDPVTDPARPWPIPDGAVTVSLRMAQVRYPDSDRLAIDGISLDLPPGRRIALVGPTGAGKSTVAAVLVRFVDLVGGTAELNGTDLASYRADDVRALISGCTQDPHLFDASVAENLRVARPDAADAELAAVLAQVGLSAWIGSLPEGLGTLVGVNGTAVSGGQRQQIALARALLAEPAVLIVDEPTTHLDRVTKRRVMANLLAPSSDRATLLITHDLEHLEQVDEIIVLDGGKTVERGTHAELANAHGLYAIMLRDQLASAARC